MTVTIGVIGVGMIGQDHIRRLTHVLAGAQVVAVSDVDPARTKEVADSLPVPARVHATGEELIADPDVQAVIVASWGPTHEEYVLACLVGREAGVLREAARDHRGGLLAHHRRRGRGRAAAGPGGLHAALRRGLPGDEAGRRQRGHRVAADRALAAPQPVGAGALHPRDGDHRHRGARLRHRAVAARRGARVRHRADAAAQPARRRPAGPADDAVRDGVGGARRRRDVGEHPLRLRHPRRGRRRGRARSRWPTRRRCWSGAAARCPGGSPRTGASGSSAPTTWSCRSGWTRSPPASGADRPQLLGRVRRGRGLRRRGRGAALRHQGRRSPCATSPTSTRRRAEP